MSVERIVVLMYHRIGAAESDADRRYCVAPERFAAQMRFLHGKGYRACDIDLFSAWLRGQASLPRGSFMLTFDDGCVGVYEYARSVLGELGWCATVFLVSRLLGRYDLWEHHDHGSGRRHPLLGRAHIEEMSREGFRFHSHSRHHADLTSLSKERLAEELKGAREDLEDLLGRAVPYLAYPYGRFDDRVRQATIDAGYLAAFSSKPGFVRQGHDPYRILRLEVFGTDSPAALARKMMLGVNDGSLVYSARYAFSRVAARVGIGGR